MKNKSKFGARSVLKFKVLNFNSFNFYISASHRVYDFLIGFNNWKTYLILYFC